jgi:hypothetical protein
VRLARVLFLRRWQRVLAPSPERHHGQHMAPPRDRLPSYDIYSEPHRPRCETQIICRHLDKCHRMPAFKNKWYMRPLKEKASVQKYGNFSRHLTRALSCLQRPIYRAVCGESHVLAHNMKAVHAEYNPTITRLLSPVTRGRFSSLRCELMATPT